MCGLYGSITSENKQLNKKELTLRNKILNGLAIAMETRGDEGCGIGITDEPKNTIQYIKHSLPASKFIYSKGYKNLLNKNGKIVLGHTRKASSGVVTTDNAHPFIKGGIMGCHNGKVSNFTDINPNVSVDSEVIFELLDKYNNDYKKAFSELEGTFAITWLTNMDIKTVYLTKNNNPLFVAYVQQLKTYFWASEDYYLMGILTSLGIEKYNIWELRNNITYEINTMLKIKKVPVSFKTIANNALSIIKTENNWWDKSSSKIINDDVYDILMPDTLKYNFMSFYKELSKKGCSFCNKDPFKTYWGLWWSKTDNFIVCRDCKQILIKNNDTLKLDTYFELITKMEYEKKRNSFDKEQLTIFAS